jgi:hypothetical protein
MGVLAHRDDESLGIGGTLAKYAGEGVETYHLVTATRGERGRFGKSGEKPSPDVVGRVREAELREAARVLGVREVRFLDYYDGDLDQVNVTCSRASAKMSVVSLSSGRALARLIVRRPGLACRTCAGMNSVLYFVLPLKRCDIGKNLEIRATKLFLETRTMIAPAGNSPQADHRARGGAARLNLAATE